MRQKFSIYLSIYLSILILVGISSCQKSDSSFEEKNYQNVQDDEKQTVYVDNGYLVVSSYEVLDSLIAQQSKLTYIEKENWENSLGFVSIRRNFQNAVNEIEKAKSIEEMQMIKSKYQGKVLFNEYDAEYLFDAPLFAPFINEEGLLKIGTCLFKYTPERIICIADGDISKVHCAYTLKEDNAKEGIFFKEYHESLILKSTDGFDWGELGKDVEQNGNRKLTVKLYCEKIYKPIWNQQAGLYTHIEKGHYIYQLSIAQKKDLGVWHKYNTIHEIKGGYIDLPGDIKGSIIPENTTGECSEYTYVITRKSYIEPFSYISPDPIFPNINQIWIITSHRGMGSTNCEINLQ